MAEVRQRESPLPLTDEEAKDLAQKLKDLAAIISALCAPSEMEAAKKNIERYPNDLNWLAGAKDEALRVCNELSEMANALPTAPPSQEIARKSTEILLGAIDQALFLGGDPESLAKFLPDEALSRERPPLEEMEPPGGFG